MSWQVINAETPRPEPVHHALDELLLDRLNDGESDPTLRFWYRTSRGIPLGRFQAYADEVAVDYVETHDISVVRRVTGGGAMYVAPGDVITFSMYLPRDAVAADIETSYEQLNQWVIDALTDLDVAISHEPLNDVVHPDGKIGGAAQLRKQNAVLHHMTMSYDLDTAAMLRALRIGEEKLSDKAVKSAEKRVAVLREYTDLSRQAVIEHLIETFQDTYGGDQTTFEPSLLADARERAEAKFMTDEWNKQL